LGIEALNDQVVPWFEEQDVRILRALTDRGTEYCGKRESHEYELYLSIEDIEEQKQSPLKQMGYANGFIRRSRMSCMQRHLERKFTLALKNYKKM